MERTEIFKDLISRYNNREGSINNLVTNYPGYSRNMFYRDLKKYGVEKDEKKDIYYFTELEGQVDLLGGTELTDKDIKEVEATNCIDKELKASQEAIKTSKVNTPAKKKKTFEIDEELEQYLKAEAIKEGLTVNELVNKTLWAVISEDTKNFIG